MMEQRSAGHDEQDHSEVGRGQKTYDFGTVCGHWRRLEGPEDVLDLMDGEAGAEGVVAVVRDAGATFLGPIFEELVGVVCTGGTIRSHIGIISREYRVPGVIGMVFAVEVEEPVNGTMVELDATGDDGIILIPAR
ncbi:MAG: PEP-utilizing enzyme [Actinomycetota bacterium]|nr:PEP-utilizing enzyme [Actinomycetota bacterium]